MAKITLKNVLLLAQTLLQNVGITSSLLDARVLMKKVLGMTDLSILLEGEKCLLPQELDAFFRLLSRRLCHEPIAYIINQKEFYGLDFFVNENTLIPRPDTESVVEKCIDIIHSNSLKTVADICTGSGAIAVTLQKHFTGSLTLFATDINEKTLQIAQKNAHVHGVKEKITFFQGDLLEPLLGLGKKVDLIVANPPYVSQQEMNELSVEVANFEPHLALYGQNNKGTKLMERLIKDANQLLTTNGYLIMEIGYKQKFEVELLAEKFFESVDFFQDLSGNTRGVVISKSKR